MYLPHAKTIADVFTSIQPYDRNKAGHWDLDGNKGLIYCNTNKGKSFLVEPSPAVRETVKAALKVVFDKNIYFNLSFHFNGTVLIVAQYNMIIGSRWLCVLPDTLFAEIMK